MATYERGDRNADEVKLIQAAIGTPADGKFGPQTISAVKTWQKANDQKANGMVGPDMLLTLGILDLLIVENGDEGELVRRIQSVVGLDEDGEYGRATVAAVRNYQKQNGLKATGSADVATLEHMGLVGDRETPARRPEREARDDTRATKAAPPAKPSAPAPTSSAPTSSAPAASADAIASWAYQLADIDPQVIASLPVDLVVVDYAADGDDATAFKSADTALMKSRRDGRPKKLIAYMSIGEAEDYRYYWQKSWKAKKTRPAWLDDLNPDWAGNYKVRYWDLAWQALILGSPTAYLDRIIAAGFDGVYLDIIDAFEYWRDEKSERPEAAQDMIAFVTRIATYARAKRPGFMVIPQNGEALLEDPAYRRVISAQAKEDIFYGQDGDGKANAKAAVTDCLDYLALARADGIPIIAIEYLDDARKVAEATAKLHQAGCCATFGPRDLNAVDLTALQT